MTSDTLNIALSDCLAYPRLTALLALQRQHAPGIGVRLREVPVTELIQGLEDGTFDVGLCQSESSSPGLSAIPIWRDALALGVAHRHPWLAHESASVQLMAGSVWITLDAGVAGGFREQVGRLLAAAEVTPSSIVEVRSLDLMMALVAAGYGVCLAPATRIESYRPLGVVGRPLATWPAEITTYLLRPNTVPSASVADLVERAKATSA